MTELSREAFLAAAVAAKDTFIEETDAASKIKSPKSLPSARRMMLTARKQKVVLL